MQPPGETMTKKKDIPTSGAEWNAVERATQALAEARSSYSIGKGLRVYQAQQELARAAAEWATKPTPWRANPPKVPANFFSSCDEALDTHRNKKAKTK